MPPHCSAARPTGRTGADPDPDAARRTARRRRRAGRRPPRARPPPPRAAAAMPSCLPSKSGEPKPDSVGTADAYVRQGFIRKVYSVLTLQFLFTVGLSAAFGLVDPIREFVVGKTWLSYVAIGVAIGCMIALYCFKTRYPFNVALLCLFTVAYASMIAIYVALYFEAGAGKIILQSAAMTAAVFVTLTAVAFITKKDFSFLGGFLGAAFIVLIIASIINFGLGIVEVRSRIFSFGISVLGALVMSGFILYDTSNILHRLGPDQWIQGVISLYLDVMNLFLYMTNILSFAQSG